MIPPYLLSISQSSGFELEELDLGADQFNGNLDAGNENFEDEEEFHDDNEELEDEEEFHDDNEELEDEEEVHDDSEEDDHHEVESNIEVDGDNDNNMLCSQNFISLLHLTPKRENFATV